MTKPKHIKTTAKSTQSKPTIKKKPIYSEKELEVLLKQTKQALELLKNAPPRQRQPLEKRKANFEKQLRETRANQKKQKQKKKLEGAKLKTKKRKGKDKDKKQYYQAVGDLTGELVYEESPIRGSHLTVDISSRKYPLWASYFAIETYRELEKIARSKTQILQMTVYPEFLGEKQCQGFTLVCYKEADSENVNNFTLRGVIEKTSDYLVIRRNHKTRKKLKKIPEESRSAAIQVALEHKVIYFNGSVESFFKPFPLEENWGFIDSQARFTEEGLFEIINGKIQRLENLPKVFTKESLIASDQIKNADIKK